MHFVAFVHPYRTGAYLIYDYPAGTNDDHFRRGDDGRLNGKTFRASGSRQLDAGSLAVRLEQVAKVVNPPGRLHLVDLRQETHLFFNGRAVSWYADKDWVNVGRSQEWIQADEQSQLTRIARFPTTQVFCIDPNNKEFARPTAYSDITVTSAATEAMVAQQMSIKLTVDYLRLPVTDHCPPADVALNQFLRWWFLRFGPEDWVHLHCHGGDGRTTTFLALYDMLSWARSYGTANFPSIEEFADRQLKIFSYNLNPGGCHPNKDWKCALAKERWQKLSDVRDGIAHGAFSDTTHGK